MKRLLAATALAVLCVACGRNEEAAGEDYDVADYDDGDDEYGVDEDGAPLPPGFAGGQQGQGGQMQYQPQGGGPAQQQQNLQQRPQNNARASGPAKNFTGMRFERGVIVDSSGFEQPTGAATLFVPYGWKTQGGVVWGQQFMCTNGFVYNWSATSPDGSQSLALLPNAKWESNNFGGQASPGCGLSPISNVRQYLEAIAPEWKPGARILDYRDRPDIVKEIGEAPTQQATPVGDLSTWWEAGEVLIAYTENGREMRGSLSTAVGWARSRSNYGMGDMINLTAMSLPAYGVTAPNGQLNLGFFEAIRRTFTVNPVWQNRIAQHVQKMNKIAIDGAIQRNKIQRETNEYISNLRQETWEAQQKSSDIRAREFGEMLRGVETYNDADAPGGTVELSHMYNDAWKLNDGSYVLSNDPNFDPWRDLNIDGQKLEVTQ
ncbi:MAG TPA: hypothetical protein PK585_03595 [Amphiplicatus sp.]|nr:hypothetical protein [Amphiplicatus sp.]